MSPAAARDVQPGIDRGFWLDLRSKRDIRDVHLNEATCSDHNFYDPLLTPKVGVVSVAPGVDWFDTSRPRSWQLNLHSFRFADFWILAYLRNGDPGILARLDATVLDYLRRAWPDPDPAYEFVRSDVSVASRAAVIAFLLGRHRAGAFVSRAVANLESALAEHVEWAAADANHNSNNHGLFNDMHLLMALINGPVPALQAKGKAVVDRLMSTYLELQVNEEGVHLEHTPAYALLWVLLGQKIETILARLREMSPDITGAGDERLSRMIRLVKATLWWFTKPSGELVNLGDQGRTDAPAWIRTQAGEPGTRLLRASGYAFHKTPDSYLAFVGAYHATKRGRQGYRAASHKQRDELHVLWSEAERDILIDTGLRGYDFGPERRYTFSKQAHNTLSLSPSDYMDAGILEYMDATSPYGSAIHHAARCENGSGWIIMAGHDPLLAREQILHVRMPLFEPGKWLLLCDLVRLPQGGKAEWNFHLAEQWRCTGYGASEATFRDSADTSLRVSRFGNTEMRSQAGYLHRGDFEPLRGWRFAGDPFAVPNLRLVEWLPRKELHLRVTAFSLGGNGRVEGVSIQRAGRSLSMEVSLALPSGSSRHALAATLPDELLALLPERMKTA